MSWTGVGNGLGLLNRFVANSLFLDHLPQRRKLPLHTLAGTKLLGTAFWAEGFAVRKRRRAVWTARLDNPSDGRSEFRDGCVSVNGAGEAS